MTYTVVSGDTFGGIAARFGVTISALSKANPQIKNINLIFPGQVLQIPGAAPPVTDAPPTRLNPYVDPNPWGSVTIEGLVLPGIVVSVDGHTKPDDWAIQKGTSSSNATTVWKGTKLAESISIVLNLFDRDQFDHYYDVRDVLRPKLGAKPPSFSIVNAAINFAKITRVSCRDVEPPKPAPGLSWLGKVILVEYNPSKPAAAGPASAAKSSKQPTENDRLASELDAAVKEAVKA